MDAETRDTFWTALARSPFVMLHAADGLPAPMTAMLDRAAHHAIWFFTRASADAARPGPAGIAFAAKGHDVFANLTGALTREEDRARFETLWSNAVAAWFPGGKDDPEVVLMRFDIAAAEVWVADLSIAGLFHLATGTPIRPGQAGTHQSGTV